MKVSNRLALLIAALSVAALHPVSAQVIGVDIGTGVPPTTLGTYNVASYDPGSIAGQSYFSNLVGGNWDGGTSGGEGQWSTWGQDYTGTVYVTDSSSTLTLDLSGAQAVYFYEEPQQFSDFTMTAKDSSGVTVSTVINGYYGSSGVGFYEMNSSDFLTSITVTATDPTGFAIGEFGINQGGSLTGSLGSGVPDTGSTVGLLGGALTGLAMLRRRFAKK
jgi:hypothetical protein